MLRVMMVSMDDLEKIIAYWREHAQYDLDTADSLYSGGRFPYSLFMCHLAIEKMLKAIIVETTGEHAPYTHNLRELAKRSGRTFSDEDATLLFEINEFNMEARYPDWKDAFYEKATNAFTKKYLDETQRLFIWLKK